MVQSKCDGGEGGGIAPFLLSVIKMKKETIIKLLLVCGVTENTIRYCTHLGVTIDEVEEYKLRVLAEKDGRMEL